MALNPDDPQGTRAGKAHVTLGATFADIWLCRLHTQLGDFGPARAACAAPGRTASLDAFTAMKLPWMRPQLEAALGRHEEARAQLRIWKNRLPLALSSGY